jgi:Glucose / Sorbosone dehydrogenase
MRITGFLFLSWLILVNALEASPVAINTNLQIRLILNTPANSPSTRIAKDPRNSQLYYLKINGDIYQVNLINTTSAKVYSAANHGLSDSVEGFAIGPDGTMYVLADFSTNNGSYGFIRIMKGVPNGSGVRVWSLLARTDLWPRSKGQFDHNCSALIVSLDGQYLYYNAGSRTDHGEVQNGGGLFPNTREVPLTAKIFRLPANGSNLLLTDDLTALMNAGYVFAQGTRNAFDFAFAPNGDLFATDNGPDRDMSDSLYWLRAGLHYGFPWRMGGMDNPQQFSNYNPTNDLLLNTNFFAVRAGYYQNDPAFPPPPTNFADPVINLGPDADEYRDPTDGSIKNASQLGRTLTTFTAHRSPLGLVFDETGAMSPPFQYHGFVLGWTPGDPNGDSVAGPFGDPGQDMLDLNMTKLGNTNYEMQTTRIVGGFANPIDAEIISNKVYVIEYAGNMGLWEITFPARSQSQQTASITVSEGMPIVNFFGVPNFTYDVQRATNLSAEIGLGWMTIEETNMPNTGEFQFWDHFGDLGAKPNAAWYRLHLP